MIKIAIIEDEPAIRKEITYLIEQESDTKIIGWSADVKNAVKLIEENSPDVILMDIQLQDGTAFDVLKNLKTLPENIIFLTAYNQFAIRAIKYGALDYLLKPIDQNELKEALERFRRKKGNNPQWMKQISLAEMNSLYQLQAKDRSIQSLSKNIKINELELQQNKLWLVITSLLALLVITFIVFFYYNLRQRRIRQEKEKILQQQQLLRTQMEPHFIFNTIAALQSFVRFDQKEKAIKYLNQFGRLLRNSLELSRENLVPLGEEMEALNNYLSLQQMRFEDAFTYEIIKPEGSDTCSIMIPPMLVQPYVENAILHGIDLGDSSGHIKVQFFLKNSILQAKITDSGKNGIDNKVKTHRSLAGIISNERLKLLGKNRSIETIKNDIGTTLILNIPINN